MPSLEPGLTCIVPTIDGREDHLNRLLDKLEGYGDMVRTIVIHNKSTCGEAWQEGVEQTKTYYVCCLADDLEPRRDYWFSDAMDMWDEGYLPVPKIWTMPSGEVESAGVWRQHFPHGTKVPGTTIPFCFTTFWQGRYVMPNVHYRSDSIFSEWCLSEGRQPMVCDGFEFNHWWAQEGRQENPYQ